MVQVAVDMIDDLGQLTSIVVDLGSRHYHYGARKEHIPVLLCSVYHFSSHLKTLQN